MSCPKIGLQKKAIKNYKCKLKLGQNEEKFSFR